ASRARRASAAGPPRPRPGARGAAPHRRPADPAPRSARTGLPRTGRMAAPVERLADLAAKYRRLQASYQRSHFYAREVRHLYTRLERASLLGLEGLADALDSRDRYTRGHSGRVGAWARQTALALGWSVDHADLVGQAGRLHDIGKIGVPEVLLRKTEALSADEWQARRGHPEIGARSVAPFDFSAEGAEIIGQHHGSRDGSGDPGGLT